MAVREGCAPASAPGVPRIRRSSQDWVQLVGLLARIARFRMAAAIPMAASTKTLTQKVLLGFAGIAITGRARPPEGRFGLPTAPGGNTPPMPPTSAPGYRHPASGDR